MDTLVTVATAADWGFTLTLPHLRRASARVRGYLHQDISSGSSTVTARGPVFRLPQRPVTAVSAVVDSDAVAVEYAAEGSVITTSNVGMLTVTYTHGLTTLPDELIELVCQVASRIALDAANTKLAQGVQTESVAAGPFSTGTTFGWDSYRAQAGLTQGEKDTLNRIMPQPPKILVMGASA